MFSSLSAKDAALLSTTFGGHTSAITACAFSQTEQYIVSASKFGPFKLWNFKGQCITTFDGHDSRIMGCAFSADGNTIISVSFNGTINMWNLKGKCLKTFRTGLAVVLNCIFSPDRCVIAIIGYPRFELWSVKGKRLPVPKERLMGDINPTVCAFSPDGDFFLTAKDGGLEFWNSKRENLHFIATGDTPVTCSIFSSDGSVVLTGNSGGYARPTTLRLWKLGNALQSLYHPKKSSEASCLACFEEDLFEGTACTLSPNSQHILLATCGGVFKLYDLKGKLLTSLPTQQVRIKFCLYSPDGEYVLFADEKGALTLWHVSVFQNTQAVAIGTSAAGASMALPLARSSTPPAATTSNPADSNPSTNLTAWWQQQSVHYRDDTNAQCIALLELLEQQQTQLTLLEQSHKSFAMQHLERSQVLQDLKKTQQSTYTQISQLEKRPDATSNALIMKEIAQLKANQAVLMREWEQQQQIKAEEELIQQHENLRVCYYQLQRKLNAWFVAYLSLSSGKITRTTMQRETAAEYISILGDAIPLPGVALITKAIGVVAGQTADRHATARADHVADIGVSISRMDQITASVARRVALHYQNSILELTAEGAVMLGEWCAKPVITWLYHFEPPLGCEPNILIQGMFEAIQQAYRKPPAQGWLPSLIGTVKERLEKDAMLPLKHGGKCSVKQFLTTGISTAPSITASSLMTHQLSQQQQELERLRQQVELTRLTQQVAIASQPHSSQLYLVLWDYLAQESDQLTLNAGEHVLVLEQDPNGWWKVKNQFNKTGYAPNNYLQALSSN